MDVNNKDLILEFFKDYKPIKKNNIITIPKASKEFEEIFGKKAPYKLVFSLNKYNVTHGSELITMGSYFLSSMKESMKNKGQTSLIKLNVKIPHSILNNIPLGNCSISKSQEKKDYNYLNEFTFFSDYQALNENKQFFKKYLMKDSITLDSDLIKFKILKSNPKEIPSLDLLKPYNLAKNNFKKFVYKDTKDIRIKLKEKLKTELKRIKEYYLNQIKEKDDEIETCKKKINNLKNDFKHTFYERDKNTIKRNIKDSEERLVKLSTKGYKERLKEEEEFHFKDEINKHSLVIENKLVNVTIFYYPIITFTLSLTKNNSKEISKSIEISYDPLFEEFDFSNQFCESCKKNNLKEINICSSGKHLCCKNCLNKCKKCKKSKL